MFSAQALLACLTVCSNIPLRLLLCHYSAWVFSTPRRFSPRHPCPHDILSFCIFETCFSWMISPSPLGHFQGHRAVIKIVPELVGQSWLCLEKQDGEKHLPVPMVPVDVHACLHFSRCKYAVDLVKERNLSTPVETCLFRPGHNAFLCTVPHASSEKGHLVY